MLSLGALSFAAPWALAALAAAAGAVVAVARQPAVAACASSFRRSVCWPAFPPARSRRSERLGGCWRFAWRWPFALILGVARPVLNAGRVWPARVRSIC